MTNAEQNPGTAEDQVTAKRLSFTEGRRSIRTSLRSESEHAGTDSGRLTKRASVFELVGRVGNIRSSLNFGTTPNLISTEQEHKVHEFMAAFEAGRMRAVESLQGACTQALLSELFAHWVYIHKVRKSKSKSDEAIGALSQKGDSQRLQRAFEIRLLQWSFETWLFIHRMEMAQGRRNETRKRSLEQVQLQNALVTQTTFLLQGRDDDPTSPTSSMSLSELIACMRDPYSPTSPKTPFTPYSPIPAELGDRDEFNVPKTPVIMSGRVEWTDISSATWV